MTDTIRILIVDDHNIVRQGLAALLKTVPGFEVAAEASDGEQAVELFRKHKPDVTLMDLRLPKLNGVEAITRIREGVPGARIVVLTTFDGDEDIYRALQAGAKGYLLKGMDLAELTDAIRSVHAGRTRIPPQVAEKLAERMGGATLTARELDVLKLIVAGKSTPSVPTSSPPTRAQPNPWPGPARPPHPLRLKTRFWHPGASFPALFRSTAPHPSPAPSCCVPSDPRPAPHAPPDLPRRETARKP